MKAKDKNQNYYKKQNFIWKRFFQFLNTCFGFGQYGVTFDGLRGEEIKPENDTAKNDWNRQFVQYKDSQSNLDTLLTTLIEIQGKLEKRYDALLQNDKEITDSKSVIEGVCAKLKFEEDEEVTLPAEEKLELAKLQLGVLTKQNKLSQCKQTKEFKFINYKNSYIALQNAEEMKNNIEKAKKAYENADKEDTNAENKLEEAKKAFKDAQNKYNSKKQQFEKSAKARNAKSLKPSQTTLSYVKEQFTSKANNMLQLIGDKNKGKDLTERTAIHVLMQTVAALQVCVQTQQTANIYLTYQALYKPKSYDTSPFHQQNREYNNSLKHIMLKQLRDTLMQKNPLLEGDNASEYNPDYKWIHKLRLPRNVSMQNIKDISGNMIHDLMHEWGYISDKQHTNATVKRYFTGPLANFMVNLTMHKNINYSVKGLSKGFKILYDRDKLVGKLHADRWAYMLTIGWFVEPISYMLTSRNFITSITTLTLLTGAAYYIAPVSTLAAMEYASAFVGAKYITLQGYTVTLCYNAIMPSLIAFDKFLNPFYNLIQSKLLTASVDIGSKYTTAISLLPTAKQFKEGLQLLEYFIGFSMLLILIYKHLSSKKSMGEGDKTKNVSTAWVYLNTILNTTYHLIVDLAIGLPIAILWGPLQDSEAGILGNRNHTGLVFLAAKIPGLAKDFRLGIATVLSSASECSKQLITALVSGLWSLGTGTYTLAAGGYYTVLHALDVPTKYEVEYRRGTTIYKKEIASSEIKSFFQKPFLKIGDDLGEATIGLNHTRQIVSDIKPGGILYQFYHSEFLSHCCQPFQYLSVGISQFATKTYEVVQNCVSSKANNTAGLSNT